MGLTSTPVPVDVEWILPGFGSKLLILGSKKLILLVGAAGFEPATSTV
jgi:hypothetical protein